MKLLVGLGNPGTKYLFTRHNAGFIAIDFIAQEMETDFNESLSSSVVAKGRSKGEKYILAKPQTYMNLSGKAVKSLLKKFSVKVEDMAVMHDDIDIPLGEVRDKRKGGTGGHNGLASIIEEIGTGEFRRLRIGVGRPPKGEDTADFVLSEFEGHEKDLIAQSINKCFELAINN